MHGHTHKVQDHSNCKLWYQ